MSIALSCSLTRAPHSPQQGGTGVVLFPAPVQRAAARRKATCFAGFPLAPEGLGHELLREHVWREA